MDCADPARSIKAAPRIHVVNLSAIGVELTRLYRVRHRRAFDAFVYVKSANFLHGRSYGSTLPLSAGFSIMTATLAVIDLILLSALSRPNVHFCWDDESLSVVHRDKPANV